VSDPAILFVKPKAISSRDKKTLQAAGVIVVEIEDLSAAKFVRAHAELSSTALLKAAAEAMGKVGNRDVFEAFSRAVCSAIQAEHGPL
jgi:hypothetical protein